MGGVSRRLRTPCFTPGESCNPHSVVPQLTIIGVLRDAPTGGPQEITFTDEVIETKAVLEQFLSLAVYSRLVPRASTNWETACDQLSDTTMDVLLHLVSFLQKYDCMGRWRWKTTTTRSPKRSCTT